MMEYKYFPANNIKIPIGPDRIEQEPFEGSVTRHLSFSFTASLTDEGRDWVQDMMEDPEWPNVVE